MCGIVGFCRSRNGRINDFKELIVKGSENLRHRGPDGSGFYEDSEILFAHRRLSIFDTSENGSQPMISIDGSKILVFNGEIYNFKELKKQYLNDIVLRSDSDTEVLLECFVRLGVERTLSLVRGMYAFSLFDKNTGTTFIGRDPFGEKPLYYTSNTDGLFFASDINGLFPIMSSRHVNRSVLKAYLRFGYCPGNKSILEGIEKLPPGGLLVFNGINISVKQLISLKELMTVSEERYEVKYERFKSAIETAVKERSAADVPVGVFLSGGVDSSVVASILASIGPIETFNLAFDDKDFDESDIAARLSTHIGSRHNVLLFSPSDALDLINDIPNVFSEPFADISLLPTLAISNFARQKVTVGLSGDGGDEFLFGYNKYFQMNRMSKFRDYSLGLFRNGGLEWMKYLLGKKKADFINEVFKDQINLDLIFASYNRDLDGILVEDAVEIPSIYDLNFLEAPHLTSRLKDIYQYLPDNILVKSDRCSMYNSLELRAPFLDLDVVRTSFAFKGEELYKYGMGKRPLRQLLTEYVPSTVYNVKNKRGFSIPIENWLRNELRPLVEYQLSERKINSDNVFNSSKVKFFYDQFYIHKQNYAQLIWSILVFNLWYDKFITR
jgi:asparagine synthase (glutamine-hydrolysing)